MWPLISKKEGDWYPAGLSSTDFRGLYGYKGGTLQAGAAARGLGGAALSGQYRRPRRPTRLDALYTCNVAGLAVRALQFS